MPGIIPANRKKLTTASKYELLRNNRIFIGGFPYVDGEYNPNICAAIDVNIRGMRNPKPKNGLGDCDTNNLAVESADFTSM